MIFYLWIFLDFIYIIYIIKLLLVTYVNSECTSHITHCTAHRGVLTNTHLCSLHCFCILNDDVEYPALPLCFRIKITMRKFYECIQIVAPMIWTLLRPDATMARLSEFNPTKRTYTFQGSLAQCGKSFSVWKIIFLKLLGWSQCKIIIIYTLTCCTYHWNNKI